MATIAVAEQMRSFNRFFTEAIGSLDDRHEGLAVSLVEARMLFTVAALDGPQVGDVSRALRLDLAYTSRVLGALEDSNLLRRTISPVDRRQRVVRPTAKGKRLLAEIERRSNARVLALIAHLGATEITSLLDAMNTIQRLTTPDRPTTSQSAQHTGERC